MKREDITSPGWVPQGLLDSAKGRTADVITKLRRAMEEMAKEVEQHEGLYPYNGGQISQSEVCRRAGVKKVTLQGKTHKTTTKVEVDNWVKQAQTNVVLGRKSVRKVVTERADSWKEAHEAIANQYHLAELELVDARQRIKELEEENEALRGQLGPGGKVVPHKRP